MKTPFGINNGSAFWLLLAAGAMILAIVGCDSSVESGFATSDDTQEKVLTTPDPLKLVAIGVPEFDEEVARQWAAQRDAELVIEHLGLDEFEATETISGDVDLFVHPSSINADLIKRKLIRMYPRFGLVDPEMNLDAFLHHFRKSLVRHNDRTWCVSMGGQQLRLLFRRDILDAAQIEAPTTWEELFRAIEKLESVAAARDLAPIVVPSSKGLAGQMMMARVACLIRDRGKLTSFFDRTNMKPTIEAPPFEDALNDLASLVELSQGNFSVGECFEKFVNGQAVFAIAWPEVSEQLAAQIESASASWGITRLPGSEKFYVLKESHWQRRRPEDDVKVDLLGIAANNISIAERTSNAKDAVEFVKWLTDKRNSQKLLAGTAAPFRATHVARIGRWYGMENADREFLDMFADAIEGTHQAKIFLMFPQLPGKRQYLKLLDDAVTDFLSSADADAKKTLRELAQQWETLTDSLGRQRQINELRNGNGI